MKPKIPRAEALAVARALVETLRPCCARIEIAGSLRREKQFVGDVEILFVPKWEERQTDFFDCEKFNVAEEKISELLKNKTLIKRLNVQGKTSSWGRENKHAALVVSGIHVDFFATDENRWWMALVIRTGPAELNIRLMTECRKHGLEGHAYGTFTRIPTGEVVPVNSEEEVFQLAGLKYQEPKNRA